METRSMRRARLQKALQPYQSNQTPTLSKAERCSTSPTATTRRGKDRTGPRPSVPTPSLSVLDVTSGKTVTIALEDGGLEGVDTLVSRIEQELKKASGTKCVSVAKVACGTKVLWNKNMTHTATDKKLDYYLLDAEPFMVVTSSATTRPSRLVMPGHGPQSDAIDITIRGVVHSVLVRMSASSRVSVIQHFLEEYEGIPIEKQALVFIWERLRGARSLKEYGISDGDCVEVFRKQEGGGIGPPGSQFVDLSDPSGPTKMAWSHSAPMWRVASPGLCVEGVCENTECSAYNEYVIMNWHFTQFDLIEDAHECSCPMCHSPVIPTTCAFTNCRWKWVGKKIDQRSCRPVVLRSHGWNTADDAYHRFDEETSGSVNWLHLKITTEEINGTFSTCVLCFNPMSNRMNTKLECGHAFHTWCATQWSKGTSTCPVCLAISNMTLFQKKESGLYSLLN